MPNWCETDVDIEFTSTEEFNKFLEIAGDPDEHEKYRNNEDEFTGLFDRFVPTPPEMLGADGGWYDWRLENWGTKWNPDIRSFNTGNNHVHLCMDTAWAPPREFFEKLSEMFPSATIKGMYLEEGMSFCGRFSITNGMTIDEYINQIPAEAYKDLGAVLDKDGNVDWDKSEDLDPTWNIVEDSTLFYKYYHSEDNAAWAM